MRLPSPVYSDGLKKSTQVRFYGYDALGTEGGIRNMRNMTADFWPELASRPKRKVSPPSADAAQARGIAAGESLICVDDEKLYVGDMAVAGFPDAAYAGEPCTLAVLGDYITAWPDRKYYDTVSGESGTLDAGGVFSQELPYYGAYFASVEGRYSTDANAVYGVLADKKGSFRVGDAVTISGCTRHPANNKTFIIREMVGNFILGLDDTFEFDECMKLTVGAEGLATGAYSIREGDFYWSVWVTQAMSEGDTLTINRTDISLGDYTAKAVVGGEEYSFRLEYGAPWENVLTGWETVLGPYAERSATVRIERAVPELDIVFAHENRLYGAKGDTIYASKWGDIFNWSVYDGTASDSWTTETGTPGAFTGGISYGGYPCFFKEDKIFTLYGDYPAEFQLTERDALGVEKGSGKSLAVANGRLFYLSPAGPCIYAGGEPTLLASAFGIDRYKNARAASDGVKYYISMQNAAGAWSLFTYDTRRGLWMREDELDAVGFACHDNEVYYYRGRGEIGILGRPARYGSGFADETDDVVWMAEFGDITAQSPDKKRVTKLQLRLEMEEDSDVRVMLMFDSDEAWREAAHLSTDRKRSVTLPIVPRRLDHFRLKLWGRGGVRISSLAVEAAAGSDR